MLNQSTYLASIVADRQTAYMQTHRHRHIESSTDNKGRLKLSSRTS